MRTVSMVTLVPYIRNDCQDEPGSNRKPVRSQACHDLGVSLVEVSACKSAREQSCTDIEAVHDIVLQAVVVIVLLCSSLCWLFLLRLG